MLIEIESSAVDYNRDYILHKKTQDSSIPMSSLFYTRIAKLVRTRCVLSEKRKNNLQAFFKLLLTNVLEAFPTQVTYKLYYLAIRIRL